VNHRLGLADHKSLAPLNKIGDDLGEGFGPVGADRVPGIINKD
jgi:hypothetical protein